MTEAANDAVKWVKLEKYCELTGDTTDAVYCRRRAHQWREGVQFKVIQRRYWINLQEVQKWIEAPQRRVA